MLSIYISVIRTTLLLFFMIEVLPSAAFANTHRALLNELPSRINTSDSQKNYVYPILYQLFEPLFKIPQPNKVTSEILSHWETNGDFTKFKLCPSEAIFFSNRSPFSPEVLAKNIRRLAIAGSIISPKTVIESNRCVEIEFNNSYPTFFKSLSVLETAMVDPGSLGGNIQIGISDFVVEDLKSEKITLKRVSHITNENIHEIEYIRQLPGSKNGTLDNGVIADYNRIPYEEVPFWVMLLYRQYEMPLLKTYILVINSNDERERMVLQNCLSIDRLREIFMPGRRVFRDVGSLTPIGVTGAKLLRYEQNCPRNIRSASNQPITFLSFKDNVSQKLQSYLNEALSPMHIQVNVKTVTGEEMAKIIFEGKRDYGMTIIGFDAAYPDPMSFFGHFIVSKSKNRLVRFENIALERMLKAKSSYVESVNDVSLYKKANEYLLETHQILPLFQEVRKFYYPNNYIFDNQDPLLMQYIKISDVKVNRGDES